MRDSLKIQTKEAKVAGHGQGIGTSGLLQACRLVPCLAFLNHSFTQGVGEE